MKSLFIFLILLFSSFRTWSIAPDLSKRFGVAVASGWDYPILGNDFDDRADGQFVFGFYGRYQFTRQDGIQFGYTRYQWTNTPTAARIYDLVYERRLQPRNWFTPLIGLGIGLVDIAHYNVDEDLKPALKARIGVEYAFNENILLDLVLDYQYVGNMPGDDKNLTIGEMHALAPQLILSYFFGK